jgi:selenocysteine-specific elongation factor
MFVIGTAGHIDHGKSTLVKALTGVDPDRLAEEKARGMTIDLRLPSGRVVSIVDVPGHERFIGNMLAGAGGIDVALLVVAADEGVMPQTREHLAIIDLLGIEHGVIALTKSDLVDEEWLMLVAEEVSELVAGTALAGSPLVPVSAVTGVGLDELRVTLERVLDSLPDHRDAGTPRLPVDRVFTVAGFGTVVTGTLSGGSFRTGQEVEVMPQRLVARIRGIQSHGVARDEVGPGLRVALNLAGINREQIARGDVVALPGALRPVHRFDACLRMLADSPVSLDTNHGVVVYAGAAEVMAHAFPLSSREIPAGAAGWVQVRLERPLALWRGQRFVIRLPSPSLTIGGGIIADIAPRRRAHEADTTRLERLLSDELEQVLLTLLEGSTRDAAALATLAGVSRMAIDRALQGLLAQGAVERLGQSYLQAATVERLRQRVLDAVAAYHARYPLRRAAPKEEVRRALRLGPQAFTDLVSPLVERGHLLEIGMGQQETSGYALPEHGRAISASSLLEGPGVVAEGARALLAALAASPFSPPAIQDLTVQLHLDTDVVRLLSEDGRIVRLSESIYLTRPAYDEMVQRVVAVIAAEGKITVARIRDMFNTSRKYALAFAEHLDAEYITRRLGDERVAGPKFSTQQPQ